MKLSRYFADHARAYDAEMDDLVSDSEGKNVLDKRLKEKRSQLDFLVMMMDDSPEMLAVAFHQGFQFSSAKAMDQLVSLEPKAFPAWNTLQPATIQLTPWAQTMAARVLQEEGGARFLTIAACLEYLYTRADERGAPVEEEDDEDEDHDGDDHGGADAEEEREARDREDAGASWMEEQGFDPKPKQS